MPKDLFTAEWFPYYFERFEGSDRVAAMSLAVEGAYHRAIRHAWRFGSVPSDPKMLAARIQKGCTIPIATQVLEMFEVRAGVPSRAYHPTVEEIRREQEEKFLGSRNKGLKGAEKRWGKKDVPSSDDTDAAVTVDRNGSAIAQPMQDKEEESRPDKDSDKDSFSETDSCVRACVKAFAHVDPRLVEIAVIKTLIQHGNSPTAKPIRSTRYFREEIEGLVIDSGTLASKTIDAMLFTYRKKLEPKAEEVPA